MEDFNRVTILGRATKNAELKFTPQGTAICNFSIANNRRKENEAIFINITVFGKLAEAVTEFITKGKQILVHGSIEIDSWEKDGQKFTAPKIIADTVQLTGKKEEKE
jgi:single-strand DNA-binding protein